MKRFIISACTLFLLYSCSSGGSLSPEERCYDGLLPFEILKEESYEKTYYEYVNQITGEKPITSKFSFADFFSDGVALVRRGNQVKMHYINEKGETVLDLTDTEYSPVSGFSEGVAFCTKGGYYYIIDKSGNELCQLGDWEPLTVFHEGLALVQKGGYSNDWALINKQGEIVVSDSKYELAGFYHNRGRLCVMDRELDMYGALDYEGNLVIPCKFEYPFMFDRNDKAIISKYEDSDSKMCYNLIDKNGEEFLDSYVGLIKPDGDQYLTRTIQKGDNGKYLYFRRKANDDSLIADLDNVILDISGKSGTPDPRAIFMGRDHYCVIGQDVEYFKVYKAEEYYDYISTYYYTIPPVLKNGNMLCVNFNPARKQFGIVTCELTIVDKELGLLQNPVGEYDYGSGASITLKQVERGGFREMHSTLTKSLSAYYHYGTPITDIFVFEKPRSDIEKGERYFN